MAAIQSQPTALPLATTRMASMHYHDADPLQETTRYEKIQSLGKGSFGFVQLGRNKQTMELVAIKFLRRQEINKYVESEILNHSQLRHPHVIQFKEVFLTKEYISIAMEYATGGSLFQYVQKQGRLKESVARWFFQQLIIGVDYCHKRGVANRDIKLENTLLQVVKGLPLPLLKICDFGYSKSDIRSTAKSKVGTLTYMAPEVLLNRDGKYDGKIADIWSCGVMLFVMLYGRYPFETPATGQPKAKEIVDMLEKMVNKRYSVSDFSDISPEGKELLDAMLLPDPASRIQLDAVMAHPWFITNLPPDASKMNDTYINTPMPPGHQTVEDIQKLLNEAKNILSSSDHPMHVSSLHPQNDSIDAAIEEDLQQYGSETLQQFAHMHQNQMLHTGQMPHSVPLHQHIAMQRQQQIPVQQHPQHLLQQQQLLQHQQLLQQQQMLQIQQHQYGR